MPRDTLGTLNHGLGPLFCCFITLFGAGGTLDPPGAPLDPLVHQWPLHCSTISRGPKFCIPWPIWTKNLRDECRTKKTFQFGHCPNLGGGVYPCPNFFAPFFYLRKKSRQWSRRRKESVKLPELGGGGVWLIRAMPELKGFFCFALVPKYSNTGNLKSQSKTYAASVTFRPLGQLFCRPTWKITVEKIQTNVTSVNMHPLWQGFW